MEQDFILDPTGKQFLDYARYNIGSMISSVEMKWNPGQSGMSLDLFVNDAALYAIELAREDHAKGLFRNENADSFRKFFYGRILKAFHTKLENLGVLRAGKPNIRAFPPPCGRWALLARDEGFFAIFVTDSKTMHHGNSISRLIGLI